MAVLQISKIQIRRGTAGGGTGIPQLASGELAWALDTQELWIGNGSVSEGAPAVGNTKIITSNDFTTGGNVLNLISHIYRSTDTSIQTGPSSNNPVARLLQDRLDDRVTVFDFGAVGDGVADDTAAIQRAIDQLFLNPSTKASANTNSGVSSRRILEFSAGTYKITSTLYVPSYATLKGAGPDKTIIRLDGTAGPLMQFINDNSVIGTVSPLANTTANTQPRNIRVQEMTLFVNSNSEIALRMDASKNCDIFDVTFEGKWNNDLSNSHIAIEMNVLSSLVTCERNHFNHIDIKNFSYALSALGDIKSNEFADMHVDNVYQAFVLGYNINTGLYANGVSTGQEFGPRDNGFNNIDFNNVKRHAFLIGLGSGNNLSHIILSNVGNDGYGNVAPIYPQIFIGSSGNDTDNIKSDRTDDLGVYGQNSVVATATRTTAGSNLITVDSISGFTYNLPIRFVGATFGGIVSNTPYWVSSILDTDNIAIQNYSRDASDIVTINTATLHGLISNQTVTIAGSTLVDEANVLITVVDSNTFTFLSSDSGVIPLTATPSGIVSPAPQIRISATSLGSPITLTNATGSVVIGTNWDTVPFIPVVAGFAHYTLWGQYRFSILDSSGEYVPIAKLPLNTNLLGIPERSVHYNIEYLYTTDSNSFVRAGDISFVAESETPYISLSDDYNFAGPVEDPEIVDVDPVALEFKAEIYDFDGLPYISSPQDPCFVVLSYKNTLTDGLGQIAFSFTQLLR